MGTAVRTDPTMVRFYDEYYNSRHKQILNWHITHADNLLEKGGVKPDRHWPQTKKLLKKLKQVATITQEDLAVVEKFAPHIPMEPVLQYPMKPVEPEVTEILTNENEGNLFKQKYFKKRYLKSPEERFYYPLSENWQYGWLLKNRSKYEFKVLPRINALKRSFGKSGVHRDPDHYRDPDVGKVPIC